MSTNTSVLFHGLVVVLLVFASSTCGQARPASQLENQESSVDMDTYPNYYSSANSMAADAMDTVDMMDMDRPVAPPPMPALSRSQLQRLLRSSLLMSQPSADALAYLAANNAQAAYAKTHGPNHLIQNGGGMPLYGARLLRMQMSAMPEMKRTARGRSMQCYFNPISCY